MQIKRCSGLGNVKNSIQKLVTEGYCIGCGGCAVNEKSIRIEENDIGLYEAKLASNESNNHAEVCPFLSSQNESIIGEEYYSQASSFDKTVGHYQAVYTGHVNEPILRNKSSSGGLLTWLLEQLLNNGKIDGVVHVSESEDGDALFNYRLSTTIEEIRHGAKSKYYPVNYTKVIQELKTKDLKVAFVGVPCFVKSIRLLCESDNELKRRIPFCISLFCGHLKSKGFADMIAWQQGVHPDKLSKIDFRVKNNTQAHQYSLQVESKSDIGRHRNPESIRNLFGMDWGLGYFKPKACDWCDDIAGETADITFGDAWLPEYQHDAGGHNIVVVRHPEILQILESGVSSNLISLNQEPVEKVYQSQAANYRHRHEGLDVRQRHAKLKGMWHPVKRIKAYDFDVPQNRQDIYLLRETLAEQSHFALQKAKEKNSFIVFLIKMLPFQVKYYWLNKRLFKQTLIYAFQIIKYFLRKFSK